MVDKNTNLINNPNTTKKTKSPKKEFKNKKRNQSMDLSNKVKYKLMRSNLQNELKY